MKVRKHAGKEYQVIGSFKPNELVKLLNTAPVDNMKRQRVKRKNDHFVGVVDYYLRVPLHQ